MDQTDTTTSFSEQLLHAPAMPRIPLIEELALEPILRPFSRHLVHLSSDLQSLGLAIPETDGPQRIIAAKNHPHREQQ